MHSYSKKLTARFLLFIFLLESCYNPNIDIGRKELPASKDPANKQSQYEEGPYDKYPPSANKSHFYDSRQEPHNATSPNEQGQGEAKEYSTQSKQKGISPQQAQEQQVRQGLLPLPSPVQEIGKDPRGQDQPRAIPAHSTSKRLSTTSSESPRQRVATKQAISVQQTTRRTTSLEEQKKLEHSQQAARAKRLEDIASRVFLAQGGQQVCFMHQDGQWQARIMERIGEFYRSEELPVVCQGHGDVQEALKALQAQDKLLHKYWVHVLPATHAHPTMVYLGRLGLLGGGNSQSSSSRSIALTPLCDVCGQSTTYMSSHRGVEYQCPDLDCTGKPTEPRQSSPQLSSSQPARTFHTATFQYAEKAQKISRYLERNSTVTSASEARHVAWRLDDYLRDLRGLSSQARSLDFAAYSRQLSQLDSNLVRELEQIRQEAEDKAIEMRHIEDANLQINDYNKELSKLHEFIEGTRCIESVSQVKKIKDQLQSSIEKLHQLAGYIGLFLGNVSNVKRSEFEDRHQKRIDASQKLDQKLAVSVRQIARSQQLEAELTRYQDRSQQIQDEFGKRFAIESPEHAAALRSQLQGHITYLNEVWSSMKSIGFDTADDREQAHENHQIHIASLEQLCSDIQQGAQALTKAGQVKEALLCYEGMMQTIDEEFSGAIRVESVEQAQQMQSSLQSHRDALLALWAEVASLTTDAPVEDLAQFHTGYLEGLQRFYEELEEIAQKLAYTQRVGAEVDRYETRMAAIREEVRTTTVIDRVEQAQQIKARLQEHIAYVRELWAGIEALREAAPEASLRQFHASNLGMLQELAV